MITAFCILLITVAVLWYFWDLKGYRTLIANALPAIQVILINLVDFLTGFPFWHDVMDPKSAAYTILGLTALNAVLRFKTDTPVGE